MTDNARIVRDFIEGQGMHPNYEARILAALSALETELATAKADLERAREAMGKHEWGLQWMLNNLHGIDHEWAKEACNIARAALNGDSHEPTV